MSEDILGSNMSEDRFGSNMSEDLFGSNMSEDKFGEPPKHAHLHPCGSVRKQKGRNMHTCTLETMLRGNYWAALPY